jgi:hypothetical protein
MSLAAELGCTCVRAYRMDAGKAVLKPQRGDSGGGGIEDGLTESNSKHVGKASPSMPSGIQQAQGQQQQQCADGDSMRGCDGTECSKADPAVSKAEARLARKRAARVARGLPPNPGKLSRSSDRNAASTVQTAHAPHTACGAPQEAQGTAQQLAQVPDQAHVSAAPPGFESESFDYVLLDAPCSALGLRPRLLQSATLKYLWQVRYNRLGYTPRCCSVMEKDTLRYPCTH